MKIKDLLGYYYPTHFEEQIVIRYDKKNEFLVAIDTAFNVKCANDFVKYFWINDNKLYIQAELNMEEGEKSNAK